MELTLDLDRGVPVYRQIFEAVVSALSTGALERDEQLPTIHDLAGRLEVNPNTVARAYRDLEQGGYIVGKRGRGTFAADPENAPTVDRDAVLRDIYDRAVADAARHRIGADELVRFFQKGRS